MAEVSPKEERDACTREVAARGDCYVGEIQRPYEKDIASLAGVQYIESQHEKPPCPYRNKHGFGLSCREYNKRRHNQTDFIPIG